MINAVLPFDMKIARQVIADSLVPHQQKTNSRFKIATDFRQQVMIKHPFLSDFHSRAEHLYAGLLEGDPAVTSYVPQPFMVRIRNKRYKLIFFYGSGTNGKLTTPVAWEFYDLEKDPTEMKNEYANPAYKQIIADMKADLRKIRKQLNESDEQYPGIQEIVNTNW